MSISFCFCCRLNELKVQYLCLSLFTGHNIDFIYHKKVSALDSKYISWRFSTLVFAFKISSLIIFLYSQKSKFSTIKEPFHKQGIFLHSRNFSTAMEMYSNQGTFAQTRNFPTVKEPFHSHENFPQLSNFSKVNKFFHKQGIFPQSRTFSPSKYFYTVKNIFCKQKLKF